MDISLAAICNQKGYKCVLVMPSSVSTEKRAAVKSLEQRSYYAIQLEVLRVLLKPWIAFPWNSYKTEQFLNPDNPQAHYRTTGVEIYEQTNGKVDMVVFGIGTGGTVTGSGKLLREKNPQVGVYGMEPYESSVLNGFPMGTHEIQVIGAGFFPKVLDRLLLNEVLHLESDDAIEMTRCLAKEEGLMLGFSSGANLAQRPENEGKLIVTTMNSYGERYLTTELYGDVMTEAAQMTMLSPEEQVQLVKKELNC